MQWPLCGLGIGPIGIRLIRKLEFVIGYLLTDAAFPRIAREPDDNSRLYSLRRECCGHVIIGSTRDNLDGRMTGLSCSLTCPRWVSALRRWWNHHGLFCAVRWPTFQSLFELGAAALSMGRRVSCDVDPDRFLAAHIRRTMAEASGRMKSQWCGEPRTVHGGDVKRVVKGNVRHP